MSTTQDYQAAEQLLRRPARPGELVIGDKIKRSGSTKEPVSGTR
jgi:hypothetical protein